MTHYCLTKFPPLSTKQLWLLIFATLLRPQNVYLAKSGHFHINMSLNESFRKLLRRSRNMPMDRRKHVLYYWMIIVYLGSVYYLLFIVQRGFSIFSSGSLGLKRLECTRYAKSQHSSFRPKRIGLSERTRKCANLTVSSSICCASSLVGAMTTA